MDKKSNLSNNRSNTEEIEYNCDQSIYQLFQFQYGILNVQTLIERDNFLKGADDKMTRFPDPKIVPRKLSCMINIMKEVLF